MIFCMHSSARSPLGRLSRFLLGPTLVVSILPLLPGAHAQQAPLPNSEGCSPQARIITVWKVGGLYENGLPGKAISEDLRLRAKSLGCAIRVEVFPAVGFANRFFAAFERHQEPDVLAVENPGVIYGVTIRPGGYTGRGPAWRPPRIYWGHCEHGGRFSSAGRCLRFAGRFG